MDNEFAILARALRQIFWGLIAEIAAAVILIGGTLLFIAARGGGTDLFYALLTLCGVLYLGGKAVTVIGMIRCLVVPPEVTGARTLVMAAVAGQLLNALLGSISILDDFFRIGLVPFRVHRILTLSSLAIYLAGMICFLVFLGRVARYIQHRGLAANAALVLRLVLGLVLGVFVSIGFAMVTRGDGAVCCSTFPLCGLALLTVVMYAQLLTSLAAACVEFAKLEERDFCDGIAESEENDRDFT